MTQIDLERTSGTCEPGLHTFLIENVEEKQGPDPAGYLLLHLRCADEGNDRGKLVWHNVSLAPQARWKLEEVLDAVGAPIAGQIQSHQLVGKYVRAQTFHEEYEGVTRDKVNSMMPSAPGFIPSQSSSPPVTTTTVPTTAPTELSGGEKQSEWDVPF